MTPCPDRRRFYPFSILTPVSISVALLLTMPTGGRLSAQPALEPPPIGTAIGRQLLTDYFDMLTSGNFETAELMWSPATLERAQRFPIQFTRVPVKVDAGSPIVRDLDRVSDFLVPATRQVEVLVADSFAKMRFENLANGKLLKHWYYARLSGTGGWLISPQDFYARGWPIVESQYYRIHVESGAERFLNPRSLALADRQVMALSDSLKLTPEQKSLLGKQKIEFYYCAADSTVQKICGEQTRGFLDQATNDLISSTFPHDHEVIHLLVNLRLGSTGIYTLPLVREGIAVHYGGRWSKAATALTDLGVFLHRQELAPLDSILTMRDFEQVGADIAYPVAGLLAGFVQSKVGIAGLLALSDQCSGDYLKVFGMDHDAIRSLLLQTVKLTDWKTFVDQFNSYCDQQTSTHAAAQPGKGGGSAILTQDNWVLTQDKQWVSAVLTSSTQKPLKGSLFFAPDATLKGTSSEQLDAQFGPGSTNDGFRYLIRVDQNEAGLYDLGTGQLTAKYIWGMTPSPEFADTTAGRIAVKFRASLFDKESLKKPGPGLTRNE